MRQNFTPGRRGSVVKAAVVQGAVVNWAFVVGHCGCGQSGVAASTVPSSIIAPGQASLDKHGIQMGYELFLSTMLSFYDIYTSSPINSASSLSSSSVRPSGTSG